MNPEMILWIEEAGDTVVHLVNGERLLVKESAEEIQQKFMEYKYTLSKGFSTLSQK